MPEVRNGNSLSRQSQCTCLKLFVSSARSRSRKLESNMRQTRNGTTSSVYALCGDFLVRYERRHKLTRCQSIIPQLASYRCYESLAMSSRSMIAPKCQPASASKSADIAGSKPSRITAIIYVQFVDLKDLLTLVTRKSEHCNRSRSIFPVASQPLSSMEDTWKAQRMAN